MTTATEAPTTTAGQPEPQTAASSEPAPVAQQTAETQPEAPQQGGKPAAQGAPETYEFKAPEGQAYDAAVIGAYGAVAKELGLSQESAQKMLDRVAPILQERQAASVKTAQAQWAEAVKVDPELGGPKAAENQATIARARAQFDTPELKKLLDPPERGGAGLGSHPEIQRLLFRVGSAISPDAKVVTGQGGPQLDPAEQDYPVMMRQQREKQKA